MNYVTDSKLSLEMDRVNDSATKSKVKDKWTVAGLPESYCGNVDVYFKDGKAKLSNATSSLSDNKDYKWAHEQISSALALYRSISLFETGIQSSECDHYKINWLVALQHKESGQYLILGEWKGGFDIFTQSRGVKELDKTFIKDAEQLLTYLVSESMTIGYDGTVAGSVA